MCHLPFSASHHPVSGLSSFRMKNRTSMEKTLCLLFATPLGTCRIVVWDLIELWTVLEAPARAVADGIDTHCHACFNVGHRSAAEDYRIDCHSVWRIISHFWTVPAIAEQLSSVKTLTFSDRGLKFMSFIQLPVANTITWNLPFNVRSQGAGEKKNWGPGKIGQGIQ